MSAAGGGTAPQPGHSCATVAWARIGPVQSTTPAPSTDTHVVVRNDEDQYALWPAGSPPPAGWHDVGLSGSAEECVAHVERVWTDMRPASVRHQDRRDG